MKKTLLTLFCAMAVTLAAKAEEVVVTFAGYNYEGNVTNIVSFPDGNKDTSINDKDFEVSDVCTFKLSKDGPNSNSSYINPTGKKPHMQWARSNSMEITPKSGITITKIVFHCTIADWTKELQCYDGGGTCSTDTEACTATWNGSQSKSLVFGYEAENNAMRVQYIDIEYTKGSSAINDIAVDNDAPVKYFNLLGVEVANPQKGGIYIRQQGNTVTKIIK